MNIREGPTYTPGWAIVPPDFVKVITKYTKINYFASLNLYICPPQHIVSTDLGS